MSKPSKIQILAEAARQGFVAAQYPSGKVLKFVACVLAGCLTKPLPLAVADCLKKLK